MKQLRRYVIGSDPDGRSYTQFDGYAPITAPLGKTGAIGVLWSTQEMPVNNRGDEDRALGVVSPDMGPCGSLFSFLIIPPEEDMYAGAVAQTVTSGKQQHPGMHHTDTIDYGVVLEGEVWFLTDRDEIKLQSGDTYVCRGATHAWSNRTDEPCVICYVGISAEPVLPGHTTAQADT